MAGLFVDEQRLVGRITGGSTTGLTPSQVDVLLDLSTLVKYYSAIYVQDTDPGAGYPALWIDTSALSGLNPAETNTLQLRTRNAADDDWLLVGPGSHAPTDGQITAGASTVTRWSNDDDATLLLETSAVADSGVGQAGSWTLAAKNAADTYTAQTLVDVNGIALSYDAGDLSSDLTVLDAYFQFDVYDAGTSEGASGYFNRYGFEANGLIRTFRFPFAFDSAGLSDGTGYTIAIPDAGAIHIGDYIVGAYFGATVAFDGTTPNADVGQVGTVTDGLMGAFSSLGYSTLLVDAVGSTGFSEPGGADNRNGFTGERGLVSVVDADIIVWVTQSGYLNGPDPVNTAGEGYVILQVVTPKLIG